MRLNAKKMIPPEKALYHYLIASLEYTQGEMDSLRNRQWMILRELKELKEKLGKRQ